MKKDYRDRVDQSNCDRILEYISKKFRQIPLDLKRIDNNTIKGTGKNGYTVLFCYDENSKRVILKDCETGVEKELYEVHTERKICEHHPEKYRQLKRLKNELVEVNQERWKIKKILNDEDLKLLPENYAKLSKTEKNKVLKSYSEKLAGLDACRKELGSEISIIEFDADREEWLMYLNNQKKSLEDRLKEIKASQKLEISNTEEKSDAVGVDQIKERLNYIEQCLRAQSYLRKLVGLHPNNAKIYYLSSSERTIEKMDEFIESGREFFVLETVFCIYGSSKAFHSNFAKVHLVISDRAWRSCNPLSVTITELKRNEFIYIETFKDGSPYQIVNHAHMTRDLIELTDLIEALYSSTKKSKFIFQDVALFKEPIQLRAQSSTERFYERYGTTENYYIIGAIFESRITFVEWFTIEKKIFDRDGMSPHFERVFFERIYGGNKKKKETEKVKVNKALHQ